MLGPFFARVTTARLLLRRLRIPIFCLALSGHVTGTIAQVGEVDYISYEDAPKLTPAFFAGVSPADTGASFVPHIQYGSNATIQTPTNNSYAVIDARALTFPRVNYIFTGPDSATAVAYFEAIWQVAGYHAAVLKSRLRRQASQGGQGGLFNAGATFASQAIYTGVMQEWTAVNEALAAETGQGQDLLGSIGFANQYRAARDTVTYPLLELSPHGMELHIAIGPSFPSGDFSRQLDPGFAMDLGVGYTHDRYLALLSVIVNSTPAAVSERDFPQVQDGRTQWNNVGLELGYRYLRRGRWEASARMRLLGATLLSGGGEEQASIRSDFAFGLGHGLSYALGRYYTGERVTGQSSGFRAVLLAAHTPQRWIGGVRGGVTSVSVGVQMTFYGARYR